MKILQTCWVNNLTKLDAGWFSSKFHFMSWALSAVSIQKYYPNIELITNNLGKEILIDKLQLPYSSISLAQENFNPLLPSLWVLRKLYSYTIQDEPFIHIDGDAYLFKPFDKEFLNAQLVAQNYEYNHPYYLQGVKEVMNTCIQVPNYLKQDNQEKIAAVNAGIMGGSDTDFFKRLYLDVTLFLEKNKDYLNHLDPFCFNIFLEQFWFKKLADTSQISICYQMSQQIGYPHNYQLDRFWDLPNFCDYIHVMNYKKNQTICEKMAQRLYIESPELYERVVNVSNELEATKVSMFIENKAQTLEVFFYRTNLISQQIGLNLNLQNSLESLTEQINIYPENPQNTILRDAFQYELEKYHFIQGLPCVDDYVQYRKRQSLKVNERLSKTDKEILLSSVTFGEYVTFIESEWKWAEINEFTGQDSDIDYTLNLGQEPSYFQVVLFGYPVSMTVKEQLSDTFTIMIIDTLQQIESYTLTIQEILENVAQEIYLFNQTITLNELKTNILAKIRFLLYQGILECQ
ncbi:DUF6734 family protein [Flectobacillus major]|uniref:DUF6734 family protein n=1 Tax=Flectobacillus major TaxID=103 RepID=UPI000415672D|nr:DUF6734 family protein [Flectobacillus major]